MLLYLKQCCVGGRHNDGETDKDVLSPLGQRLSLPADVDLLPNMNQLHGSPKTVRVRLFQAKNWTLPLSLLPLSEREMEEREPPWSRNKNRGGMGMGGEGEHTAKG